MTSARIIVGKSHSQSREPEQLMCLTITAYARPDLSEGGYRRYMTKFHAPLVTGVLEKHGIIRYTIVCYLKQAKRDSRC